jgi:thiosulfate dehydrogenase
MRFHIGKNRVDCWEGCFITACGGFVAKGFVLGVVVALIAAALIAFVGVQFGLIPANADARPSKFETWVAKTSLHATINREMPRQPNPVAATSANFDAGIKLYGQHCIACHGGADGKPSTIAIGLYQKAPQLGKHGVEDDPDGVTYWKIYHGIRLTGMPAFSKSLNDTQIWTLTLFLKHMDTLPPGPKKVWQVLKNPVALAPASALAGSSSRR